MATSPAYASEANIAVVGTVALQLGLNLSLPHAFDLARFVGLRYKVEILF
jgi:hypothetical protein